MRLAIARKLPRTDSDDEAAEERLPKKETQRGDFLGVQVFAMQSGAACELSLAGIRYCRD